MIKNVKKRDGTVVPFDVSKIENAIEKAMKASKETLHLGDSLSNLSEKIASEIKSDIPEIEDIQDKVENVLMENGYNETAKSYILYRENRTQERSRKSKLMRSLRDIEATQETDRINENANINGRTAMGAMLQFGSETSKNYTANFIIDKKFSKAHENGDIHIHDMDFLAFGTTTCTQIDLEELFKNGFNTGHGYLRKPRRIESYAALTCIAIQSNQNDQHGGQSIPNFDRMLAPGVVVSYIKNIAEVYATRVAGEEEDDEKNFQNLKRIEVNLEEYVDKNKTIMNPTGREAVKKILAAVGVSEEEQKIIMNIALKKTNKQTYQAMESLIHNLNTMNSRAGAQVPFSSINYGTDTSEEARMIVKNILLATQAGLGQGETPIFPIQIFRCKTGINFEPGDPNYDLFELACKTSAKRLFPNFSFQDAPYNLQYYKEGDPRTEIAYMGCRTRVMGNVNGPEIAYSRGNLSFTSINLPRIGILAKGDWKVFYKLLLERLILCKEQLIERYNYQCRKRIENFPFCFGQKTWLNCKDKKPKDTLEDILKNGTLSIGFIGLAETLIAMTGKHHGEDEESRKKGLEIVRYMRKFCDDAIKETHLNFSLLATPAEGLSGRFVRIDKAKFGIIEGVTDKKYYTNSFHVPVYYKTTAVHKIDIEAPYHELTNAGHISYIELDGDPSENISAFMKVVKYMGKTGIGYGAINHPLDFDPCCGYQGIINDTCPKCGRKEGSEGIGFNRIRRITGYLVGTLDRFNDAKRAEVEDRIKHQ